MALLLAARSTTMRGLFGKVRTVIHLFNLLENDPSNKSTYPAGRKVSKIGSYPIVGVFESRIRGSISKLRTHQFDSLYVICIGL